MLVIQHISVSSLVRGLNFDRQLLHSHWATVAWPVKVSLESQKGDSELVALPPAHIVSRPESPTCVARAAFADTSNAARLIKIIIVITSSHPSSIACRSSSSNSIGVRHTTCRCLLDVCTDWMGAEGEAGGPWYTL